MFLMNLKLFVSVFWPHDIVLFSSHPHVLLLNSKQTSQMQFKKKKNLAKVYGYCILKALQATWNFQR